MSSSGSVLPPEYDDIQPRGYDPAFTADISTKMRIPDKLGVNGYQGDNADMIAQMDNMMHMSTEMQVPDRIMVAGQDQHIGLKQEVNLDLEYAQPQQAGFGLATPPRVLTLSENSYQQAPVSAGPGSRDHSFQTGHSPGSVIMSNPGDALIVGTPTVGPDGLILQTDEDEMSLVRRQMSKVSRRLAYLENENKKRSQRETILYPMIVSYFLYQVAVWFLRNN